MTVMTMEYGPFLKAVRHSLRSAESSDVLNAQSTSPKRCDANTNLGPPLRGHFRLLVEFAVSLGLREGESLRVPDPELPRHVLVAQPPGPRRTGW
jgi:hypothetical protein